MCECLLCSVTPNSYDLTTKFSCQHTSADFANASRCQAKSRRPTMTDMNSWVAEKSPTGCAEAWSLLEVAWDGRPALYRQRARGGKEEVAKVSGICPRRLPARSHLAGRAGRRPAPPPAPIPSGARRPCRESGGMSSRRWMGANEEWLRISDPRPRIRR